jgi:hypothetical protein
MKPKARTDLVLEDVLGECVLYDPKEKRAHHMNQSLSWIWKQCDGMRTLEEIIAGYDQEFGSGGYAAVRSAMGELEGKHLLEEPLGATLDRRQFAAGAGALTFPALTSILAPTPAMAKSHPDKPHRKK